ncbi:MAG TPA: hypothetical protein VF904_09250 [Anaeromyxobacteraceae bacterium]
MRSSAIALALAGSLAGCTSRELPVRPFRITVVDESGQPVVPTAEGELHCSGRGRLLDATTFTLDNTDPQCGTPRGITIHFEPVIAELEVPAFVGDAPAITVDLRYRPDSRGPEGEPLPFVVLRIGEGVQTTSRLRLLLGEGDARLEQGIPLILLGPETVAEQVDVPFMEVVVPSLYVEPSDCGDIYRDRLRVGGFSSTIVLDFDEHADVEVSSGSWRVQHVQSWHRAGADKTGGSCATRLRSWTQAAAWR